MHPNFSEGLLITNCLNTRQGKIFCVCKYLYQYPRGLQAFLYTVPSEGGKGYYIIIEMASCEKYNAFSGQFGNPAKLIMPWIGLVHTEGEK